MRPLRPFSHKTIKQKRTLNRLESTVTGPFYSNKVKKCWCGFRFWSCLFICYIFILIYSCSLFTLWLKAVVRLSVSSKSISINNMNKQIKSTFDMQQTTTLNYQPKPQIKNQTEIQKTKEKLIQYILKSNETNNSAT